MRTNIRSIMILSVVLFSTLVALPKLAGAQDKGAWGSHSGVPSEEQLKKLTLATLLEFDKAVKGKDFTNFYRFVSKIWQDQTNAEEIKKIFQVFIDKEADIAGIKNVSPVFSPEPAINEDKLLLLVGQYPTWPYSVHFKLTYIQEQGKWKLFGLNVNLLDDVIPPEAVCKDMVTRALLTLDKSVKNENFSYLYNFISEAWKAQTSAEALQTIFQSFIDKEVDMSGIAKVSPVFKEKPAMEDDTQLRLVGRYPTRPYEVTFELSYLKEDTGWMLSGLGVNVDAPVEGETE